MEEIKIKPVLNTGITQERLTEVGAEIIKIVLEHAPISKLELKNRMDALKEYKFLEQKHTLMELLAQGFITLKNINGVYMYVFPNVAYGEEGEK